MRWKRNLYFAHRWIALIVSLQLLAWSIGGFMFSVLDIDDVHGDFEKRTAAPVALRADRAAISPAGAIRAAATQGVASEDVVRLSLRQRFDRTVYELFDAKNLPLTAVDAQTGEVISRVSIEEIRAAALNDFAAPADITSLTLLEGEPPLEYRGGAMPVYQVILDHPKETHLYLCPVTARVLKRRNDPWRLFDFFWMLHIMDYGNRDNFNHWLLTAMSVLAILTSATGLVLWWWRTPWAKRRAQR